MGRKRYRQMLGLVVALVLPSMGIAWLGWQVLSNQEEINRGREARDREQAERERQAAANEISADVRDRLNRIKERELTATLSVDGYSDPSVALVARSQGGKLVLPWESPEIQPERIRQAEETLRPIVDAAGRLTYALNQPSQAADVLRAEIQKPREPIEAAYLRSLLRRTLKEAGRRQEADDLAVQLLKLPSDMVDGSSKPRPLWQTDAADILIQEGIHEREVLARVEQDLTSFAALARWDASLRDLLIRLQKSRDPTVVRGAEANLALLRHRAERLERLRRLPQAEALKAAFPTTVGVTPEKWPPFTGEDGTWFIGMAPARGGQSLVVAVRAEETGKIVEDERRSRGVGPQFRIAAGGDTGYAMGESLPGWRAILPHEYLNTAGSANAGIARQQWFYALSVALTLGLAFFGGHMIWRDVRRESRMAELRSQFVSSVSHELKTPLTGIRMLAETLQMPDMCDAQTHAQYLDTIVGETERLTRLLNNVLDFSKIERGQKSYRMETASLARALGDAARAMRFPLAEQGFDFHMEISSDVPDMRIDRDAIEQAVINLLSNAMKYSGESRRIDLRLSSENGSARIQVTDRGIGVAPEQRKRIFEKFYRVQTPENRAISGTGLGLALVAHIVDAHGGSVDVDSTVGKGSTFTIRIPIRIGETAGPQRPLQEKRHPVGAAYNRPGGEAP